MALQESINDREKNKFRDAGNNLSRVAVTVEDGLLKGVAYDKIGVTYPTSSTELYTYFLTSIQQAQILLTYTNSSKNLLSSAERL